MTQSGSDHDDQSLSRMSRHSLIGLFLRFLRFGCLAWGGPTAQIEMLKRELVDAERWVDEARFRRALSVYQALPGPEAHELCCWFGMNARGRAGAVAAGLGFMLPGLALMLVASWLYVKFGVRDPMVAGAFTAAQAAIVALVVRASVRLARSLAGGPHLGAIALMAAISQPLMVPFWIPLLFGGVANALLHTRLRALAAPTILAAIVTVLFIGSLHALPARLDQTATPSGFAEAAPMRIFAAGLSGGLVSFGGAYTAIPVVRDEAVGPQGWMSEPQFLDGLAIGGVLPAPLVIFATFVGYLGGGFVGALLATLGIFLPAFSFTLIGHRLIERAVENERLHAFLDGVAASVAGLIAATSLFLLTAAIGLGPSPSSISVSWQLLRPWSLAIAVVALALLFASKSRWAVPAVVLGAALFGAIILR